MKFNIRTKLIWGFSVIILLMVVVGSISLITSKELTLLTQKIINHPFTVSNKVKGIIINIHSIKKNMRDMVESENRETITDATVKIIYLEQDTLKLFATIKQRYLGNPEEVRQSEEAFVKWKPIRDRVVDLLRKKNKKEANRISKIEEAGHVDMLLSYLNILDSFAQSKASEFYLKTYQTERHSVMLILTSIIVGLSLAVFICLVTLSNILPRLSTLVHFAKTLEASNYTYRLPILQNDEFGDLTQSLNNMAQSIQSKHEELSALNKSLEEKVSLKTEELQNANEGLLASEQQLRAINEELQGSKDQLLRRVDESTRLNFDLTSKIKELQCLHDVVSIIEQSESLDEIFLQVSNCITRSLSHADTICLKVAASGITAVSDNYTEGKTFFSQKISANRKEVGEIVVVNSKSSSSIDLLQGEKDLLKSIADRLGSLIERDINLEEKKQMQQQLFQTSKLASIGELAAGVGHEINNPLAIIQGFMEMIASNLRKDNINNPTLWKALNAQQDAIHRIETIVQGLRTFSRNDKNVFDTIDVNKVTQNALSFLGSIYEKEGITIIRDFYHAPLIINGCWNRFQQIITNILSNARDALDDTENAEIKVKTELIDSKAVLHIEDNGYGIPEERLAKIFEAFYTTKDPDRGTGLGLSITKNLMDEMKGTIRVNSLLSKGSCFTLSFPLENNYLENTVSEGKSILQSFPPVAGNVLVVDDEPYIRTILEGMLNEFGLHVETATNGKEAYDKIQKNDYQYLITDIKMPEMDGIELIKKIHQDGRFQGKIYIISGMTNEFDYIDLRIDGYLSKPFSLEYLYYLISDQTQHTEGHIQTS